jgi:SlyX protein
MDEAQQVARLEERLAWLERHVVEQDKVMLELSDDLTRLRRELHVLRDRAPSNNSSAEPDASTNERPPHY